MLCYKYYSYKNMRNLGDFFLVVGYFILSVDFMMDNFC